MSDLATSSCGTTTGYAQGCRCDVCREAVNEYQRQFRAGVRKKKGRPFKAIKHGSLNAYVKRKCRCRECRLAWRQYTREQARRLRGYTGTKAHHSICEICGKDFTGQERLSKGMVCCSGACLSKAWRLARARRKSFTAPLTAEAMVRAETRRSQEINAAKANPELAALIEEQERDERVGHLASAWTVSLDAVLLEDGSERHEWIGSADLDPALLYQQKEYAETVNALIGGRTEEDIRRLDYHTQEFLAAKLREAGLAAIPVMRSERARLQRREKVAAHRHSRPSKKPRKRWTRDEWETWDAA